MYDVAIIGAGINGCSTAHEFTQRNKKVIVLDMDGIASGGSGAAGAFIAPKFSKSGELKDILHSSFKYSMAFYEKNFPNLFSKVQLFHIAKDENEDEILKKYKENTSLNLFDLSDIKRESVSIDAGIVNAKPMCEAMLKMADFVKEKVNTLIFDDGVWIINDRYKAKELILATGAYESIIKEPYIKLRGVWGHRIDIKTTTQNPYSIHQFVSISPTKDGILAIGATHNLNYHPQTTKEPYDYESGRKELLEKALKTIKLDNVEIIKDYVGLRSGAFDYMPIIGSLVISNETMKNKNIKFNVKKANYKEYEYHKNLYMINGSGGYGFVLAPYLAKLLCEHILDGKEISDRLTPARFFARWVKKA